MMRTRWAPVKWIVFAILISIINVGCVSSSAKPGPTVNPDYVVFTRSARAFDTDFAMAVANFDSRRRGCGTIGKRLDEVGYGPDELHFSQLQKLFVLRSLEQAYRQLVENLRKAGFLSYSDLKIATASVVEYLSELNSGNGSLCRALQVWKSRNWSPSIDFRELLGIPFPIRGRLTSRGDIGPREARALADGLDGIRARLSSNHISKHEVFALVLTINPSLRFPPL